MDDVVRKYNNFDWAGFRRSAGKLKARAASNLKDMVMTDIENKVRAATSDTTWGATAMELEDIARATYNREEYPFVMGIVWERISLRKWRNVYKALELLKYLCLNGSHRCLEEAREAAPHLESLRYFRYVDGQGKDEGRNVRERAKHVIDVISDPQLLVEEREKSKALRSKIGGGSAVSSDDYRFGNTSATSASRDLTRYGNEEYDHYDNEYGYDTADNPYTQHQPPQGRVDDLLSFDEPAGLLPAPESGGGDGGGNGLDDLFSGFSEGASSGVGSTSAFGGAARASAGYDEPTEEEDDDDDMFDPRAAGRSSAAPAAAFNPLSTFSSDTLGALPKGGAPAPAAAPAAASNPPTPGFDFFSSPQTGQSAAPRSSGGGFGDGGVAAGGSKGGGGGGARGGGGGGGGGFDVFGDLVSLDNLGRSSREKRHDVRSGGSTLKSLSGGGGGGGGGGAAAAAGSTGTSAAGGKDDLDALFGL